jgi:hypothetical protein
MLNLLMRADAALDELIAAKLRSKVAVAAWAVSSFLCLLTQVVSPFLLPAIFAAIAFVTIAGEFTLIMWESGPGSGSDS